jgi:hypothetical protein
LALVSNPLHSNGETKDGLAQIEQYSPRQSTSVPVSFWHTMRKMEHALAQRCISLCRSRSRGLPLLTAFIAFFQHRRFAEDRKPAVPLADQGWFDSQNPTFELHPQGSCSIGECVKIHSEFDDCAQWRTVHRNYERTAFAHVTTVAFTLSLRPGIVGPPKVNRHLQREPYSCSG